jgi:TRAP transporter TAXI family solute receptor
MPVPDRITARIPQQVRALLVAALVVLASAAGLFTYANLTSPRTLTLAAGALEGDLPQLLSAVSNHLTKIRSRVRLRLVEAGTMRQASEDLSAGKADLLIVRADIADPSAARTVVIITHALAMIIVPPGAAVRRMDDLKGRTVGVVAADLNRHLIEVLTREYDLVLGLSQFKEIALADVPAALRSKQMSAILLVAPLSGADLAQLRDLFPADARQTPGLIAIESARAIANVAKAYESHELPKGALRGSPMIPDEDLSTLRVPLYLVANKNIDEDDVADVTRAIMEARRDLLVQSASLAQIAAPSTEKDAYIPVHPGAAAFYDGTQKSFFDRYGDALYAVPILLGMLAWLATTTWNFVRARGRGRSDNPLHPLDALADPIRTACTQGDLAVIKVKIDNILMAELEKYSRGDSDAGDAAALSLAALRLEHLIEQRRASLPAA